MYHYKKAYIHVVLKFGVREFTLKVVGIAIFFPKHKTGAAHNCGNGPP